MHSSGSRTVHAQGDDDSPRNDDFTINSTAVSLWTIFNLQTSNSLIYMMRWSGRAGDIRICFRPQTFISSLKSRKEADFWERLENEGSARTYPTLTRITASDNVSVLIRTQMTVRHGCCYLLTSVEWKWFSLVKTSEAKYFFWEVLSRAVTISPFPPLLLWEKWLITRPQRVAVTSFEPSEQMTFQFVSLWFLFPSLWTSSCCSSLTAST